MPLTKPQKALRIANKLLILLFMLAMFGYLPLGYALAAFFISVCISFCIVASVSLFLGLEKYISSTLLRLTCTLAALVLGPVFWIAGIKIEANTQWDGVELYMLFMYGTLFTILIDLLILKKTSTKSP